MLLVLLGSPIVEEYPMKLFLPLFLFVFFFGCSVAPEKPVTRQELMRTQIYQRYLIEDSPEEVLDALNREGEVMLKAHVRAGGKEVPIWVKVLATREGIDVGDYDR